MAATGVLVAVGAVEYETHVLAVADDRDLRVIRRCVDLPDLLAAAGSGQAQAALVSVELAGLDAQAVSRLAEHQVRVIGVVSAGAAADETRLRRLGVSAVVAADQLDTLPDVVAAALTAPSDKPSVPEPQTSAPAADEEAGSADRGEVIAVWGPRGAPGRSLVALEVAAALAADGQNALLVDLDVYGGSTAQMLGMLDESSGLLAAARAANAGRLGPGQLAQHASTVSDGLRVLTGLPRADRWTEVPPSALHEIVQQSRSLAERVVLDCGFNLEYDEELSYDTRAPRRNGVTHAALELCDVLVVVGRADPVGLGRLVRGLVEVSGLAPGRRMHVVVNRMRHSLGWSQHEVAETLGRVTRLDELTVLPEDQPVCDRALARGRTIAETAPGSRLGRGLHRLAGDLAGQPLARHGRRRVVRQRAGRPRRRRR